MHIKTVRVTNPKNAIVQVPGFIAKKWGLSDKDRLEVYISDDEQAIIIRPSKIQARSNVNQESERLFGSAT
jgi:bifunctional DNA-binding transcriptional regulator/antitoxin component of YhaV-PrlF toxin-antitoxin module